jgi:hypothetical protein
MLLKISFNNDIKYYHVIVMTICLTFFFMASYYLLHLIIHKERTFLFSLILQIKDKDMFLVGGFFSQSY